MKEYTKALGVLRQCEAISKQGDIAYQIQQWMIDSPQIMVEREEILQSFPNVPVSTLERVLQNMVQGSMLITVGPTTYYKNMDVLHSHKI